MESNTDNSKPFSKWPPCGTCCIFEVHDRAVWYQVSTDYYSHL